MLWLLMNHDELCVCDFVEVLVITQSKASRHLRILHSARLVDDRRVGAWVHYALRPQTNPLVRAQLAALRKSLATNDEAQALVVLCQRWLEQKGDTCQVLH